MKRLTVKKLIKELSKFNPNAYVVTDNFDDMVELDLSWVNKNSAESVEPRDIDLEKRKATHVSINFIVNGDPYRGIFDEV